MVSFVISEKKKKKKKKNTSLILNVVDAGHLFLPRYDTLGLVI